MKRMANRKLVLWMLVLALIVLAALRHGHSDKAEGSADLEIKEAGL